MNEAAVRECRAQEEAAPCGVAPLRFERAGRGLISSPASQLTLVHDTDLQTSPPSAQPRVVSRLPARLILPL